MEGVMPGMTDDPRLLVRLLHTERSRLAEAKAELSRREAEFTAANLVLIEEAKAAAQGVHRLETGIRGWQFGPDSSKQPVPGVTVKVVRCVAYDRAKALEWALVNKHDNCLTHSLNAANFEKAAEGLGLDWVAFELVPTVAIARDLSEAAATIDAALAHEKAAQAVARMRRLALEEIGEAVPGESVCPIRYEGVA